MISILIVTHYSLGDSYRKVVQHFFGNVISKNLVISSYRHDTSESLIYKIEEALNSLPTAQPVLILTDIFGATPCNVLNSVKSEKEISVITGLNIPMLVKALQDADKYNDVSEFAKIVVQKTKESIISYNLEECCGC